MEFLKTTGVGMRLFLAAVFIIIILPWLSKKIHAKYLELPLSWPRFQKRAGHWIAPLERILAWRPRARGRPNATNQPIRGQQAVMEEKFRVPKEHAHTALVLWAVAILCLLLAFIAYAFTQNLLWALAGMLCVVPAFLGFTYQESASRRERALRTEEDERSALIRLMPTSWTVRPRQTLKNGGNVDIHLELPNGTTSVIEIKTWPDWSGNARKQRVLRAVTLQKRELAATHVLIWLPRANEPATYEAGDVTIIAGRAKALIKTLDALNEQSQSPNPTTPEAQTEATAKAS